jgi:F0F1-type ATP synthase assembly protein I
MSIFKPQEGTDSKQYSLNLALTMVAGQVGCLTTVFIVVALLLGMFIDSRLGTKPTFMIIFVVGSVPITLGAMFWVVRNVTSRIKTSTQEKSENLQEDENRGTED